MLSEKEEKLLNFIAKGKNRIIICISLKNEIKSISDIAKESNISLPSLSRTLKNLVQKNVVIPLSDNINGNNLYKLNEDVYSKGIHDIVKIFAIKRRILQKSD